MKIAYVHLMKTAGSAVDRYLKREVCWNTNYRLENSWLCRKEDWSNQELLQILDTDDQRVYVHNHADGWPADTLQKFIDRDWFTFCFYRHPGDQWCSFYHWARTKLKSKNPSIAAQYELDQFLNLAWSDGKHHDYRKVFQELRLALDLPTNWREMNYVGSFSRTTFLKFTWKYFRKRGFLLSPVNQSISKGYSYYRRRGQISNKTHELLLQSQRHQDYQEVNKQPHTTREDFYTNKSNNFFLSGEKQVREQPGKFIILFQGRAGSTMLIQILKKHPSIFAFFEAFDLFPATWANQKKWLKNYYEKLPLKNRDIRVLGFKSKFTSLSQPEKIKEYIEKQNIKIIHLTRANPVKLAVSVIRAHMLRERTGQSNLFDDNDRIGKTTISPERFQRALEMRTTAYQELNDFVKSIDAETLNVEYESLLENGADAVARIYEFLGVRNIGIPSLKIKKHTPDDLREVLENFDELREAFPELQQFFD